ncbi:CZB domain-containing protein [Vreelandella aquamarina]|uniref:CZB domain-containing protein n=1 Tax=Vreelandella aquamarina TaxID=77097 RepID=UPI00384B3799
MFAFMRPFQTIRRLEQEVAKLRTQLAAEKNLHGCRAISLMSPVESMTMLQAKGAEMLNSLSTGADHHAEQLASERATLTDLFTRLHHAEQTAQAIKHQCQRFQQAGIHYAAPLASEQALSELRKLGVELSRNAGHTRALAMTTALEAAHLQQEPSGLSAIVSDIQHLADHTQHLGHQLDHWVEQFTLSLKEDARVQAHQRETTTALANAAQAAEQVIEQLTDQARHMYKVIHHSTTTACLHAAKLEHAVWKSRIYHQLLSACSDDPITDHQHCTLGRWYFMGEGQRYKHTEAYRLLAAPHRRFHESGLDALRYAHQGDHTGQLSSLALMEEASVALAKQIDQLMEQAVYEIPMPAGHPSPLADAP